MGKRLEAHEKQMLKLIDQIKKDVAALKKKPDPALTKRIRESMVAYKKLDDTYEARVKEDKAELNSIFKAINPGL
jgi:hypothetical protein